MFEIECPICGSRVYVSYQFPYCTNCGQQFLLVSSTGSNHSIRYPYNYYHSSENSTASNDTYNHGNSLESTKRPLTNPLESTNSISPNSSCALYNHERNTIPAFVALAILLITIIAGICFISSGQSTPSDSLASTTTSNVQENQNASNKSTQSSSVFSNSSATNISSNNSSKSITSYSNSTNTSSTTNSYSNKNTKSNTKDNTNSGSTSTKRKVDDLAYVESDNGSYAGLIDSSTGDGIFFNSDGSVEKTDGWGNVVKEYKNGKKEYSNDGGTTWHKY